MKNLVIMLMVLFSVSLSAYSQPFSVTGLADPTATFTSGDVTICSGESVDLIIQLTNGPTWDLEYNDGSNHLISVTDSVFVMTVTPTSTTTYTLLGISNSSCSGAIIYGPSPNSGDVTVIVNPLPLVNITNVFMATCYGSSTGSATADVLTGMAPYSYFWDNTWANPINDYLNAGLHDVTVTDANGCQGVASVTIGEPNELVIAGYNTVDVNCAGPNSGAINLVAGGGTLPYSYDWSNGDTIASISGLTAGNYTATVTDANGCVAMSGSINVASAIGIVTVIQLSTVTHVNCYGTSTGSAAVSITGGSAPFTYLWNGPNNNQSVATATGLEAGVHNVTVSDANGCTSVSTITINEPNEFIANFSSTDVNCDGSVLGSASVVPSGGTMPYSYSWGTGDITSSVSNLEVNSYYVTVSDVNGCIATSYPMYFAINQDPTPTASVSSSGTGVSCSGTAVSLTATGGDTYYWSTGQTDSIISVTPTATAWYTVTVYNAYGCAAVDSIQVDVQPMPLLTVSIPSDVCAGSPDIDLSSYVSANPSGGNWLFNGPGVMGSDFSNISSGVGNHVLTIQYHDPTTGCVADQVHNLSVHELPNVSLDLSEEELCLTSGIVQLTGGLPVGGYYVGSGIDSLGNFDPVLAGSGSATIQYLYTDINSCSNSEVDNINVVSPAVVSINMPYTDICSGDGMIDVTVSIGGGAMILYGPTEPITGSYLASSGAYAFELDPNMLDGDYQLVYSLTSSACGGEDSIELTVHNTPDVFVSFPADINNLSDTVDYVMNFTTGALVTVNGQTLYGNIFSGIIWKAGQHEIVATVDNGYCIGKDSITVYVLGADGIEELDIASLISIYPNPVNDVLNIEMGDVDVSEVQIINSMGQVVYQNGIEGRMMSLDVSTFTAGMYFVRFIEDGSVSDPIKFIKQQ